MNKDSKQIKFPDSFIKEKHEIMIGVTHWKYYITPEEFISIIGGNTGHEDGISYFEVWFTDEMEPRRYQTAAAINEYLDEHYNKLIKQDKERNWFDNLI